MVLARQRDGEATGERGGRPDLRNPRYYVWTWDTNTQQFTPQGGVRCGPWSLFGLRRALRRLREMGYSARKGDPAVLVERDYR